MTRLLRRVSPAVEPLSGMQNVSQPYTADSKTKVCHSHIAPAGLPNPCPVTIILGPHTTHKLYLKVNQVEDSNPSVCKIVFRACIRRYSGMQMPHVVARLQGL